MHIRYHSTAPFHFFFLSCIVSHQLFFPRRLFTCFVSVLFGVCQDLPALYLKGGSIIPVGHPLQHVGEANLSDDLTLFVALDEHG